MTTIDEVLRFIDGADSLQMTQIAEAHRRRAKQMRREAAYSAGGSGFVKGARVVMQGLSPKYLNGTPGTLTGRRKGTKFEVEFDPHVTDHRAFARFGRTAFCPATALRLAEPPAQTDGHAAKREKIRKLLAKADSTQFPFEAESLRMKAAELQAEIDEVA